MSYIINLQMDIAQLRALAGAINGLYVRTGDYLYAEQSIVILQAVKNGRIIMDSIKFEALKDTIRLIIDAGRDDATDEQQAMWIDIASTILPHR